MEPRSAFYMSYNTAYQMGYMLNFGAAHRIFTSLFSLKVEPHYMLNKSGYMPSSRLC